MLETLKQLQPGRFERPPGWPVVLLRLYAGGLFAAFGWKKIAGGRFPEFLPRFLEGQAGKAPDWYAAFIDAVVLPNAALFGYLVMYGELLVGLALILGIVTRVAALVGLFIVLNFHFVKGLDFFVPSNYDSLWAVVFVVLAFTCAGRVLGLDAALHRRYPKNLLW